MSVSIDEARHYNRLACVDAHRVRTGLGHNLRNGSHSHYHAIASEERAAVDDAKLAHLGSCARARRTRERNELRSVLDDEFRHR
jgi:hypothetical protein